MERFDWPLAPITKTISTIMLLSGPALLATSAGGAPIFVETVVVGDVGNAPDSTGYGAVGYEYHIGKHEVTNAQYVSFLNSVAASDPHGLYNPKMSSSPHGGIERTGTPGNHTYFTKEGFAGKPVNFVSFLDAARFANWLTTEDTDRGVYNLEEALDGMVRRDWKAWAHGGVAIASEDEWYKAAYYDPALNSGAGGYWLYPTASNSTPPADANFGASAETLTPVGFYSHAPSAYGTFDQAGNVWEWIETDSFSNPVFRGGSFAWGGKTTLQSTYSVIAWPGFETSDLGFRVTSLEPIPEPVAYSALLGLMALSLAWAGRAMRTSKAMVSSHRPLPARFEDRS